MDAVKFLRTYKRMCKFYEICKKDGCPMKEVSHCDLHDPELDVEKAVAAAEKWDEEHPEKTMAQDFFEKHSNAPRDENGLPMVCPYYLGYEKQNLKYCAFMGNCERKDCWSRPMEEV